MHSSCRLTRLPPAQQLRDAAMAKQEQRLEKERLASQFYRSQEWENAKPLYLELYQQFNSQHYFSYYLNCLIQLNEFEEAEKQLKAEINKNPGSTNFMVDLGYMYQLQGEQRKADRLFNKIIKDLVPERNRIAVTANAFRARNLDSYALEAYNFGSEQPSVNYPSTSKKPLCINIRAITTWLLITTFTNSIISHNIST